MTLNTLLTTSKWLVRVRNSLGVLLIFIIMGFMVSFPTSKLIYVAMIVVSVLWWVGIIAVGFVNKSIAQKRFYADITREYDKSYRNAGKRHNLIF